MKTTIHLLLVLTAALLAAETMASEPDSIRNFRSYSDTLASAGQPDEAQIRGVAEAGYRRVIDLSFNGGSKGIDNEDQTVIESGMRFVQIPVDWHAPEPADFRTFAAVMQAEPDAKTLVHCQANFRASAFSFLYRVAVLGEDIDAAAADMHDIWTPNATWTDFISDTLEGYGIDYDCDDCTQPDNN